jgi:hypothetical protein
VAAITLGGKGGGSGIFKLGFVLIGRVAVGALLAVRMKRGCMIPRTADAVGSHIS